MPVFYDCGIVKFCEQNIARDLTFTLVQAYKCIGFYSNLEGKPKSGSENAIEFPSRQTSGHRILEACPAIMHSSDSPICCCCCPASLWFRVWLPSLFPSSIHLSPQNSKVPWTNIIFKMFPLPSAAPPSLMAKNMYSRVDRLWSAEEFRRPPDLSSQSRSGQREWKETLHPLPAPGGSPAANVTVQLQNFT